MQECFGCCSIYLSMLLPWQRIMARSRWSDGGAIKWLRLNEDKRGTILAKNTLHGSGHSSSSVDCCYWLLLCFIAFYWFMFAVNLLFIYWPRSWTGPRTTDRWLSGVDERCLRPDQDIVSGLQDDDSGFFLSANFHISCRKKVAETS